MSAQGVEIQRAVGAARRPTEVQGKRRPHPQARRSSSGRLEEESFQEGVSLLVKTLMSEAVDDMAEDMEAEMDIEAAMVLQSALPSIEESDSEADVVEEPGFACEYRQSATTSSRPKKRPPQLHQTMLDEALDDAPQEPECPSGCDVPEMVLVAPISVWFAAGGFGAGLSDQFDFLVDIGQGLGLSRRSVATAAAAPKRRPKALPAALEMSLCAETDGEAPRVPDVPRGSSRPSTPLMPADSEAAKPARPRSARRRPSIPRTSSTNASPVPPPPLPHAPLPPAPAFGRCGSAHAPLAPLKAKGGSMFNVAGAASRSLSSPKSLGFAPMSAMALDLGGDATPATPRAVPSAASPPARPPVPHAVMKDGKLSFGTKQAMMLPSLPGASSRAGPQLDSAVAWRSSSGRSLSLDNRRLRLVT